jgi:hypothetical protein
MVSKQSNQLLERLPDYNKLWETSFQGEVFNKYTLGSEQPILYNSSSDGSATAVIALDSTYNVANVVAPIVLTNNGYKQFTDEFGLSSNYANSLTRQITFDAGEGNNIYINPIEFGFEHEVSSAKYDGITSMFDRLGITASNTLSDLSTSTGNLNNIIAPTLSPYLYQSEIVTPIWGSTFNKSRGGYGDGLGGWIFPSSSGIDTRNNNSAAMCNTWHKINSRYIRFYFQSDSSVNDIGWNILVAREVVPTITRIHELKDSTGATLNTEKISNLWFFGKTMNTIDRDALFISNDIIIRFEINQDGTSWWPLPTSHVISTDDYGGFLIPYIHNFGFNNMRIKIYNTSAIECRIDLFFRYS